MGYQFIYNANKLCDDMMQRRCSYLLYKLCKEKMERNSHETTSRWKMYGKWLFSEDLEVRDAKAIFKPFLKFGQAIVKAIFIKSSWVFLWICGLYLELGRQWKVIVFHMYFLIEGFAFLRLKVCMEMTLENFTRKMCYDYFQVYDITLICSLFVRILYFNYMFYY
jgi:hypothetical protein